MVNNLDRKNIGGSIPRLGLSPYELDAVITYLTEKGTLVYLDTCSAPTTFSPSVYRLENVNVIIYGPYKKMEVVGKESELESHLKQLQKDLPFLHPSN